MFQAYRSTERAEEAVSPDQVIQATRPVAIATSKAVAAANSGRQDDMVAAANQGEWLEKLMLFELVRAVSLEWCCSFLGHQWCVHSFNVILLHSSRSYLLHQHSTPCFRTQSR